MAEWMGLSTNRQTIREQAVRHPTIAFVTLAYAITWITWPFAMKKNNRA